MQRTRKRTRRGEVVIAVVVLAAAAAAATAAAAAKTGMMIDGGVGVAIAPVTMDVAMCSIIDDGVATTIQTVVEPIAAADEEGEVVAVLDGNTAFFLQAAGNDNAAGISMLRRSRAMRNDANIAR
mmetsp:Transcript_19237/g.36186  ORF Transcript_19237/g.36186 Transcript_19237/m.36186 type:complete len:125 (+) Transcript_19237:1064-1438(+)